jgi:hypothetical protein
VTVASPRASAARAPTACRRSSGRRLCSRDLKSTKTARFHPRFSPSVRSPEPAASPLPSRRRGDEALYRCEERRVIVKPRGCDVRGSGDHRRVCTSSNNASTPLWPETEQSLISGEEGLTRRVTETTVCALVLCRVVRCSHHAPPPRMRREGVVCGDCASPVRYAMNEAHSREVQGRTRKRVCTQS